MRVDQRDFGDDTGDIDILIVIEVADTVVGDSNAGRNDRACEQAGQFPHGHDSFDEFGLSGQ
jgi:hypothetical protein